MAISLFSQNMCQFSECNLNFANLHDLLQHIEESHISVLEEEMMKNEEIIKQSLGPDATYKPPVNASLPLSLVYKLFPKLPLHKATPAKFEPLKASFCQYKKKLFGSSANINQFGHFGMNDKRVQRASLEIDEESVSSQRKDESNDADQGSYSKNRDGTDERRHKCPVDGCNKRYKNLQGARYHARQVHGYNEDTSSGTVMFDLTPSNSNQSTSLIQANTPSRYANVRPYKCNQCSKRYKTIVGLNNHIQQSHARTNNPTHPLPTMSVQSAQISAPAATTTNISHPGSITISNQLSSNLSSNIAMGSNTRVTAQMQTIQPPLTSTHYYQQQSPSVNSIPTSSVQTKALNAASNQTQKFIPTQTGTAREPYLIPD